MLNEITTESYFTVQAAKLDQHLYFKGMLTSKFMSKDMILWKRCSMFVPKEDRKLCIPY